MRDWVREESMFTLCSERAGRRLAYIQPCMTKVQRLRVTGGDVRIAVLLSSSQVFVTVMYIPKGASRGAATPTGALLRKDMASVYFSSRSQASMAVS